MDPPPMPVRPEQNPAPTPTMSDFSTKPIESTASVYRRDDRIAMSAARCYNARVILSVLVKPRARRPRVVREGDSVTVWVDAPPVDGRANERALRLIAEEFGVPRSAVRLRAGRSGRTKLVEVVR